MLIVEKPPRNSAGLNLQRRPSKKRVNDLRTATWNVLSLYWSGAYRSLGDVMKHNKSGYCCSPRSAVGRKWSVRK
jgi:hypothetical protein